MVLQGRYRIERVLGQGGMGAVYEASHEALGGRKVAIKEMMVTVHDANLRKQAIDQFQREAQILAGLEHPGLVAVVDFFTEEGGQYLVMELVAGRTLEKVVNQEAHFLKVTEVVGWMDQVCDVLEYLHTRTPAVLVRDLKPDNIMLDQAGRIRVIDFGIARVLDPQVPTNTFLRGSGTPGYAPIEQYGGRTDERADIYALGATLYSLLTREVPPPSVLRMSGEETLVRPSLLNPGISTAMEAAILRMMAVYRDDRHASISEVREALRVASLDPPGEERFRFCTQCGKARDSLDGPCSGCGARLEPGALRALTHWLTDLTPAVHSHAYSAPPTPDTVVPAPQGGNGTGGAVASAPTAAPGVTPGARSEAAPGAAPQVRFVPLVLLSAMLTLGAFGALRTMQRPVFLPLPSQASLMVSSSPSGAALVVDGAELGTTPQKAQSLGVGLHEIRLSADRFHAETFTLQVQRPDVPGGHPRLRLVTPGSAFSGRFEQVGSQGRLVVALQPTHAEVVVDVRPDGGDLLVDGKVVRHTLLRGTRIPLSPGRHALEMRRTDCAPVRTTIDAVPGRVVTWTDTMASQLGTVTFRTTPAGATVYVDGRRVGTTPVLVEALRPTSHVVRFERAGCETAEVKFSLAASESRELARVLSPIKGVVALEVEPAGFSVKVDGRPQGTDLAAGARISVVPGRHEVELQKEGYTLLRQVVVVKAGEIVELRGRFQVAMASMTLDSSPSDAWVMVDGRAVGRTPLNLPSVRPGTYRLKVWKDGYAVWEQTVTLAAGAQESLTASLTQASAAEAGRPPVRPRRTPQGPPWRVPRRQQY